MRPRSRPTQPSTPALGGPLLGSAGRLIRVNTAIFSPSGASLPASALPDSGRQGEPHRCRPLIRDAAWCARRWSVTGGGQSRSTARSACPGRAAGAHPARRAGREGGLKAFARADGGVVQGDVITAINDRAVDDADDMLNALEKVSPATARR